MSPLQLIDVFFSLQQTNYNVLKNLRNIELVIHKTKLKSKFLIELQNHLSQ